MKWLLICIISILVQGRSMAEKLKIVDHGNAKAVIVLSQDAALSIRHGAEEIQRSVKQISGAELPIVSSVPPDSDKKVSIVLQQDTHLAEEEFQLKSSGNTLTISGGGKRGVLYGCYALLEDILGCKWYTSTISYTPKHKTIILPEIDRRDKPAFEYREPYYTECFDGDWAVRNRVNGNGQHLDDVRGSRVIYGKFVHTYADLVPPKTYFDSHPEYYSLINGKRVPNQQLCLTNPEILDIAVKQVREWIKENPQATIYSVSQNDTYGNCQCDKCIAVNKEEGAPSGLTLRFANAVAQAIEKDYPNVLIDTLGYQWTEDPPLHERPRKNVRIRLAPIGACFSHPIDKCDANKKVYANLKAWAGITDQLYIWHYSTNFAHYLQPVPDLDEIAGDIPLFKKMGVVGVFYEGDYAPGGGGGEMSELKGFIMSKLLWNPSRPVKPIIDDYLKGVYGKAAPYIQKWQDILHTPARTQMMDARLNNPPNAAYLSPDVIAQGLKLFDQAEKSVKNQPITLDQVQKARLALEYVELMQQFPKYRTSTVQPPLITPDALKQLIHIVENKIKKYDIQQVREGQPVSEFLKMLHSEQVH